MSKMVKKVGRAIGKVVDGAKKLVKKVAKSKIFKVIAIAAAVYFTGGAALGAMGGASAASAAGTSMIAGAAKGAIAGLGSAGAGISSAWGNLIGGNIAGAGSSLAGGMTGASAAGGGAAAGGFTSAMSTGFNATKGLLTPGGAPVSSAATGIAGPSAPTSMAPGASGGSISSMPVDKLLEMPMTELQRQAGSLSAGQISGLKQAGIELGKKPGLLRTMVTSPLTVPMAMQVGGNMLAGKGEQEYVEERDRYAEARENDDRARYNRNIGTRLFVSNN
ncbi:MAG: hypothetical protein Q8L60_10595 [Gammaproteobacteria bacterium]|nr:hypothetical protein [Gammaproteobacteria bacterium]MDP2346796.1 hypothetical protein [Gammaproteobacteria bacterium]